MKHLMTFNRENMQDEPSIASKFKKFSTSRERDSLQMNPNEEENEVSLIDQQPAPTRPSPPQQGAAIDFDAAFEDLKEAEVQGLIDYLKLQINRYNSLKHELYLKT